MTSLTVAAPGPSETAWLEALTAVPCWPVPRDAHVVVVSPHPDDETLGLGGTLQRLVGLGARVDLVAVTDGEASHPGVAGLAARRRGELGCALARLGILEATRIHHLGVHDGAVADHEARVAEHVADLATADTVVLGPYTDDGHTDHDAAGRATVAAADRVGAAAWHYPVWAWHWHDPGTSLLLTRAQRVPLPTAVLARKRRAAAAYTSQLTEGSPPVVPPHVVRRLLRADEVLVPSCV